KIGIPDAILLKPGRLTSAEREIMKEHPIIGARLLAGIQFLEGAMPVVLSHQECFDGSGYPDGLRGDRIPLGARIFSIVDTFDAMTSDRPYRRAVSYGEALREIRQHAGTQFDPRLVEKFESIPREDWDRIRQQIEQGTSLMDEDDQLLPPP
ncbi:MAG: HD domain-containing phosphohydrolase, partial [Acidobacteriota bacterium]